MTLLIGKTGKTLAPSRAFTLIELIVVMVLMAVAISVALPSLRGFFRGRTLDSEARRLLALTRQGQSRAVAEGMPVILWVDVRQGTYGLEVDSSYVEQDTKAVQFNWDANVALDVVASTTLAKPATGPATGSAASRRSLPQIRFLPDGGLDESSLKALSLMDRDGTALYVAQSRNRLSYEIRNSDN